MTIAPKPVFLEDAHRIGTRLTADAEWSADRCNWTIAALDIGAGPEHRTATPQAASPTLYQGAAGISLFLAELAGVTEDRDVGEAAVGGLRHALTEIESHPVGIGFHSGRIGVAYAAARAGALLEREDLKESAWALLSQDFGTEDSDKGIDVIDGSAGALMALLSLAGDSLAEHRGELVESARRMGDHLVSSAHYEAVGWSWRTGTTSGHTRNLTGYAHGTAGIAHALLELFRVTGAIKYRYAATQALLYEQQWFDADRRNWPDFRHMEVADYTIYGRLGELRERLRAGGSLEPFEPTFMWAWCHGAPGIGLARLRAHSILPGAGLREEAEVAAESTLVSLGQRGHGHSLCHGRFGNAETVLLASEMLDKPEWRERARAVMEHECEGHGRVGKPWRAGTVDGRPDPSLLLGDAGVGHALLRFDDASVPSVLCLDSDALPAAEPHGLEEAEGLAERYVDRFFESTRVALRAAGAPDLSRENGELDAWGASAAHEQLLSRMEGGANGVDRAEELEDWAHLDLTRFRRWLDGHDGVARYTEWLSRDHPSEIDWMVRTYRLAPHATVHLTGTGSPPTDDPTIAECLAHSERVHLFFETPDGVIDRRISGFTAAVLVLAKTPTTARETCTHIEAYVGGEADSDVLSERIAEQAAAAYRGGILELVSIEGEVEQPGTGSENPVAQPA